MKSGGTTLAEYPRAEIAKGHRPNIPESHQRGRGEVGDQSLGQIVFTCARLRCLTNEPRMQFRCSLTLVLVGGRSPLRRAEDRRSQARPGEVPEDPPPGVITSKFLPFFPRGPL